MPSVKRVYQKILDKSKYTASSERQCQRFLKQLRQESLTTIYIWLPKTGDSKQALIESAVNEDDNKFYGHVAIDIPAGFTVWNTEPGTIKLWPDATYLSFSHHLTEIDLFQGSRYFSYEEECEDKGECSSKISLKGLHIHNMQEQLRIIHTYSDESEQSPANDFINFMQNPLGSLVTAFVG